MALALCAHPRPALRACEEERLRTHAPGTQRNETTALAPPSGLPGSPSPREKPMVVCVPPTVPFGTSSVPKRPRSHYLVTSRGYIAAGIAGGPFKGRSGRAGLPRHQGCSRAGSRAGALVRRRFSFSFNSPFITHLEVAKGRRARWSQRWVIDRTAFGRGPRASRLPRTPPCDSCPRSIRAIITFCELALQGLPCPRPLGCLRCSPNTELA